MANPANSKIRSAEHEFEDRRPGKPSTASLAPAVPVARGYASMAVQPNKSFLIPTPNATAVYLATVDLRGKLHDWKAPTPAQKLIQKDLGKELMTLNQILYDAKIEESIEDGFVAIPPTYPDLTASAAPSLGKLQMELEGLGEEPLPPELAEAVKNLTAKLETAFQIETEAKPQHPAPHRNQPAYTEN